MGLIVLDTVYNPVEASIMRSRLETAGIAAVTFDGHIASLIGPGVSGVRLMVDEADEADARALLDL